MFCIYCGLKLDDGSKFCYRCGGKQLDGEQQNETTQQLVPDDTVAMEETSVEVHEENDQADNVTDNLPINETSEKKEIEESSEEVTSEMENNQEESAVEEISENDNGKNEESIVEEEAIESEDKEEVAEEATTESEDKEEVVEEETTVSEAQEEAEEESTESETQEESVEEATTESEDKEEIAEEETSGEDEEQSVIFCVYCGTELEAGSKFCYNCGKPVEEESEEEELKEEQEEPQEELQEAAQEAPQNESQEEVGPEEAELEETVQEEAVPDEVEPEEVGPEEAVPEESIQEESVQEETAQEEVVQEEAVPEEVVQEEQSQETETNEEQAGSIENVESVPEDIATVQEKSAVEDRATEEITENQIAAESQEEQPSRFCTYCGGQLEEDANFCIFCGKRILEIQPEEATSAEEATPVEEAVPEEEATPDEEVAPEGEATPVEEVALEKEVVPVEEEATQAEETASEEEAVQVEEEAIQVEEEASEEETTQVEEEATPVEETAQVEEATPVEEEASEEETTPVEETASEEEVVQVEEEATPVEEVAPVEEATPVEEAVPVEEVTPEEEEPPAEETASEDEVVQVEEEATPVEEAAPVEEETSEEETVQVEEEASEEETVQVEEATPVEEAVPVEEVTPEEEEPPAEEATSEEEVTPVEEAVPVEKVTPEEEEPPVEGATSEEETTPVEEATPVEKAAPVEETTPVEEAPPTEEAPSESQSKEEQQPETPKKDNDHQPPLSVPQDTPKKKKKTEDSNRYEKPKKNRVGIVIVGAVVVIAIGGFGVYSKAKLNHLGDCVETFKSLVQEKGLSNVEEYTKLIEEAEDKANGFVVFGASELESKIADATTECEKLSGNFSELRTKREEFNSIESKLILDETTKTSMDSYLATIDNAINSGDLAKAQQVMDSLIELKSQIETENKVYVESLLEEAKSYSNPDFSEEENATLKAQITLVENLISEGSFVKAKEEAQNCSVVISDLEAKVEQEKLETQLAELSAKPKTLTVLISDSIYTDSASRKALETELKKKFGIEITFQQYAKDNYDDAVNKALTSNTLPDVVYLPKDLYRQYVAAGYLADLTDFWNQSELLKNNKFTGAQEMENLKIDGKLYGFTPQRGNAVVTYVRKSWLEQVGMKAPTNYNEFIAMLTAFTENKMGDSKNAANTFGMTAPGFMYNAEPYVSFLQQFYQNAYPDLMQDSQGKWIDGFADETMVEALNRLRDAYAKGLLDPKIANNSVTDAVNAFANGKCGVISLWEGQGADELSNALLKKEIFDDIIVLDPITECGAYLGEESGVFAVTTNCKQPGGVVKYFFEPMLDDNEVQNLWTYGVKGVNWDDKAEHVQYSGDFAGEFEEGQFHALAYKGYEVGTYNFNLIDPLKAFVESDYINDQYNLVSDLAIESSKIAKQYYKAAPNPTYNEIYWSYFNDIQIARLDVIKKVVVDGEDAKAAIEEYNYNIGGLIGEVLDEMNQ